ncbi:hypothetical protein LPB19_12500 [Marinobacter salinisoli]|uniref:Uncharacterized protein n=1 Tax=Marinobacter salinisoli TaxID=2769486 RepID=A0ABX7MPD2_9GAMM|nr:hypothetical protein [Marinobacter salinisoli]QSP94009.1 hypothetical protein LPB19_12500 [Marinobacter salinisoli]
MSAKSPISQGDGFYLYFEELLCAEPQSAFLQIDNPTAVHFEKETFQGKVREQLVVEISSEVLDRIAIDWIKKRKLQGAVGGPVGLEWGSPDCPYD